VLVHFPLASRGGFFVGTRVELVDTGVEEEEQFGGDEREAYVLGVEAVGVEQHREGVCLQHKYLHQVPPVHLFLVFLLLRHLLEVVDFVDLLLDVAVDVVANLRADEGVVQAVGLVVLVRRGAVGVHERVVVLHAIQVERAFGPHIVLGAEVRLVHRFVEVQRRRLVNLLLGFAAVVRVPVCVVEVLHLRVVLVKCIVTVVTHVHGV